VVVFVLPQKRNARVRVWLYFSISRFADEYIQSKEKTALTGGFWA